MRPLSTIYSSCNTFCTYVHLYLFPLDLTPKREPIDLLLHSQKASCINTLWAKAVEVGGPRCELRLALQSSTIGNQYMNDQTEVSSVESSTPADHAPLPIEAFFEDTTIRTVKKAGEFWFVASDIAKALEYSEAKDMLRMLKDDEADRHDVPIRSENGVTQNREVLLINEKGMYRAIFRSNKKTVETFQDWVFGDLLPTLRKEGSYHMALKDMPKEPWSLEEINRIVDAILPPIAPPTSTDGEPSPVFVELNRPTAHQKREDERTNARERLQAIRAGYGVMLARYPHFESTVKQAAILGNKQYIDEAEDLQEKSREFGTWAWNECLRLDLSPEHIPTLNNPSDLFWRLDFAELFKAQFRINWQKYVLEESKARKAFEPEEDIRYLLRFK